MTLDFAGGGRRRSWRQLGATKVRSDGVKMQSFPNTHFTEISPVALDCLRDLPQGRHSSGLGICQSRV